MSAAFGSSFFLNPCLCAFVLAYSWVCSVFNSFPYRSWLLESLCRVIVYWVPTPRRYRQLVGLSPFDPNHPLYKRQICDTGPLSHRELIRLLWMSTLSNTLEFPPSPLFAMGEEAHGAYSTTTLWIPGTLVYRSLHVASTSHPVGTCPLEFMWCSNHIPKFSTMWSGTKQQTVPLATSLFTFGMSNV